MDYFQVRLFRLGPFLFQNLIQLILYTAEWGWGKGGEGRQPVENLLNAF